VRRVRRDIDVLPRMVAVAVTGVVAGDRKTGLDLPEARVHGPDVHVAE
jgi:hypothetical protein